MRTRPVSPLSKSSPSPALALLTVVAGIVACSPCPRFSDAVDAGTVATPDVTEASGLAGGRRNPDVLWVHNDSGDAARLFALDGAGAWRGTFPLLGTDAVDWEDLAIGPGPEAGASYLYVGDVGDNAEARTSVRVYRVAEPIVPAAPDTVPLAGVEAFDLVYPDRPHDAETLLVDPATGDLYLVTKPRSADDVARVFEAPAPLVAGAPIVLAEVATIPFGSAALPGSRLPTGGDIDPRRELLAIRTYTSAYAWCFESSATTVAEALAGPPCDLPLAFEIQGESLGFAADAASYYTLSELASQTLHRYDRRAPF